MRVVLLVVALFALLPGSAAAAEPWHVGLQAGHWLASEMPSEQARLRTQTGTYGGGWNEWELNLAIARRAAEILEANGVEVDVLPATVPPGYEADAFVALHADGDLSGRYSGFKLAHGRWSVDPSKDDALLEAIQDEYGAATGLPVDPHVSRNMLGYYAFSSRRFTHAIAPTTPSVILEMGFMTSWSDLDVLLGQQDAVAAGVARGVLRFLNA